MPVSSTTRTLDQVAAAWPTFLPGKMEMSATAVLNRRLDTVRPWLRHRIANADLYDLWRSVAAEGAGGQGGELTPMQKARCERVFNIYTNKLGLLYMGDKADSSYNCAGGTLSPILQGLLPYPKMSQPVFIPPGPGAGRILQSLYEPLPPGRPPAPGDVAVFGEGGTPGDRDYKFAHIGTVVGDLRGQPLIYGKDGFYGTFVGTTEQWCKGYGQPRYYRLKSGPRELQALKRNHPVVDDYHRRVKKLGIQVEEELLRWYDMQSKGAGISKTAPSP